MNIGFEMKGRRSFSNLIRYRFVTCKITCSLNNLKGKRENAFHNQRPNGISIYEILISTFCHSYVI